MAFRGCGAIASERGVSTHFARAIAKYGKENFKLELIEETESYEDAQEFEKLYIEEFNSINQGYNMAFGGGGTVGFKVSEETKQKLQEFDNYLIKERILKKTTLFFSGNKK